MPTAFTNKVGGYNQNSFIGDRTWGSYFGNIVDYKEYYPAHTAYSDKGMTIHSDGKSPTPYARTITQVTSNKPGVFHPPPEMDRFGWVYRDVRNERHISRYKDASPILPQGASEELINCQYASELKALGKVTSASMQLGADLAESVKTTDMIADLAKQLAQSTLDFKRGNLKRALSHLGLSKKELASGSAASKRWLEFVYGWTPLAQSIHDAATSFQEGLRPEDQIFLANGSQSSTWSTYSHVGDVVGYSDYEVGAKSRYAYRVSNATIAKANALGILNPLSIAWELVPFSFVVDWFCPVGNFLEGLTANLGLSFVSGYTSLRVKGRHAYRFSDDTPYMEDPGSWMREDLIFRRETGGYFPIPHLYAKQNPFSTKHVLNATALIRQLF